MSEPFYVTGGTLRRDDPSYVERRADTELYEALLAREYCYVLTSRQMGKSSLMVRTAARLRQAGCRVAVLDLTALGQNVTVEQWYDGLLSHLGQQLDLEDELDDYCLDRMRQAPLQRFLGALREVILPGTAPQPLVLMVDEIDAVLSLPFSTDEFFAGIRECYNRRTQDPRYERLTFCLLGVATPSDLIRDTRTTPFNIGRRVELTDFTAVEALPLALGLGLTPDEVNGAQRQNREKAKQHAFLLLKRVLHWTGGHPYLTQRLCQAVSERIHAKRCPAGDNLGTGLPPPAEVDQLCHDLFLSAQGRERDDNLLFVRERLLRSQVDLASLLDLYSRILAGRRVNPDDTNPLLDALGLSGVVRLDTTPRLPLLHSHPSLRPRNRIYAQVFNRPWVLRHMPNAELQRQKSAFRRGVLRASMISAAGILAMSGLTGIAVGQAAEAREARQNADGLNQKLQAALAGQRQANRQLAEALAEAQTQRNHATQSASRALTAEKAERSQKLAARAAQQSAETSRTAALAARTTAVAQKQLAIGRLVRLHESTGQRMIEENDFFGALPWFAEALRLEPGDGRREAAQRLRLAATLRQGPQLAQFLSSQGEINQAAFSPESGRLATATSGGAVQVWTLKQGEPSHQPLELPDAGSFVAVTRDGSSILTADWKGKVCFRSATTGAPLGPTTHLHSQPRRIALSTDGRLAASVSWDDMLRIWRPSTGQPTIAPIRDSEGRGLWDLAFHPDGRRLLVRGSTSHEGFLQVWDAEIGQPISPRMIHMGLSVARFDVAGTRIVTAGTDPNVRVWDAATGVPLLSFLGGGEHTIDAVFSPDGSRILTASYDRTARLWDAQTGAAIGLPMRHRGELRSARFSPDGKRIATASLDQTARIWSAVGGEPLSPPLPHLGPVASAEFSPDGNNLITVSGGGQVRVWELSNRLAHARSANGMTWLRALRVTPDSRYLLTGADAGVFVWDQRNPELPPRSYPQDGAAHDVVLSPNGRCFATAGHGFTARPMRVVEVREIASGHLHASLPHPASVSETAFSPNGRRIATICVDGSTRIWEAYGGKLLRNLKQVEPGHSVVFTPDGHRLLTGSGSGARLWDVASGRLLRHFPEARGPVSLDPRGTRFLVGNGWLSWDLIPSPDSVRVWELASGRPVTPPLRHSSQIHASYFSPDGRRVLTVSADSTAQVWDARTGARVTPPLRHSARVCAGAFSPNGRWVATGSWDGTACVWDATTGELVTPPLSLSPENRDRIESLAFSPDGHALLTGHGATTVRTWDLRGDSRPLPELRLLAELISGRKIDSHGRAVTLRPEEALTAWQRVSRKER